VRGIVIKTRTEPDENECKREENKKKCGGRQIKQ
jgi:hypothetical protein